MLKFGVKKIFLRGRAGKLIKKKLKINELIYAVGAAEQKKEVGALAKKI